MDFSFIILIPIMIDANYRLSKPSSICVRKRRRLDILIKVAECCAGLETLVLFSEDMKDTRFHKLIAKFPQLRSLWMS